MDKIIQLITGQVACESKAAAAFRASMLMALKSGTIQAFESQLEKQSVVKAVAYALVPGKAYVNTVEPWDVLDPNLPENSVAVLYYEGMTTPWKSFNLENKLAQVQSNPRIVGTLIFLNTPGGYIHRIDTLSESIRASVKPVAAYITGICASAGQWLSSSTRRVFSASATDVHGSIGTMTSYMEDEKFWEEMGIKITDLYATASVNKNHKSRTAEDSENPDRFKPIIEDLDFYNAIFHNTIATNRGLTVDLESKVFDGSDFHTDEAISLGLCDERATLDTALNWVLVEGLKSKTKNNF